MSAEKVGATPGPWRAIPSGFAGAEVLLKRAHWEVGSLSTRKGVALVFGDDEANAHLISSAPDLLALAKRYASECAECGGTGGILVTINAGVPERDDCDACADIRAVIEKAEGGA